MYYLCHGHSSSIRKTTGMISAPTPRSRELLCSPKRPMNVPVLTPFGGCCKLSPEMLFLCDVVCIEARIHDARTN